MAAFTVTSLPAPETVPLKVPPTQAMESEPFLSVSVVVVQPPQVTVSSVLEIVAPDSLAVFPATVDSVHVPNVMPPEVANFELVPDLRV
jgi:hypothetical protein